MRAYNFFVSGPKFIQFLFPNVGGVVYTEVASYKLDRQSLEEAAFDSSRGDLTVF